MIKSKQQLLHIKRVAFLVLLLVSPFLVWFIILLLFGLHLCQPYDSLTPTPHSPSVRSYSQEGSLLSPPSAICSGKRWRLNYCRQTFITSSEWFPSIHSHTSNIFFKSQDLIITMACLIFLGDISDECSLFHRWGSLLLHVGAPDHELNFIPISVFAKRIHL